ncbi:MAG TPA: hypothetical protein VLZ77_13775 [Acidimicrobiales bacterium]|nr:hypothetical protein [Acidimicrobiales bacterium]
MATFQWECPTYGCRGLISVPEEPRHDTRARCEPEDTRGQVCGREMIWDSLINQWLPAEPFRGFR